MNRNINILISYLKKLHLGFRILVGVVVFLFVYSVILLFLPPLSNSLYPSIFIIHKGETVRDVGVKLKQDGIISSVPLFILTNKFYGGKVQRGSYRLVHPTSILSRSRQFASGDTNAPFTRLRIEEQSIPNEFVDTVLEKYPHINRGDLLEEILKKYGRLYPETYFLPEGFKPDIEDLLQQMENTFIKETEEVFATNSTEFSDEEILTIASLVELEAAKYEDRRNVAGVIFNRLKNGMPLQIDAVFLYINGRGSLELTRKNLKDDNPYNVYVHKGLPPGPISNPTVSSIKATLDPAEHDYVYFITDTRGKFYFNSDFAKHSEKRYELYGRNGR